MTAIYNPETDEWDSHTDDFLSLLKAEVKASDNYSPSYRDMALWHVDWVSDTLTEISEDGGDVALHMKALAGHFFLNCTAGPRCDALIKWAFHGGTVEEIETFIGMFSA